MSQRKASSTALRWCPAKKRDCPGRKGKKVQNACLSLQLASRGMLVGCWVMDMAELMMCSRMAWSETVPTALIASQLAHDWMVGRLDTGCLGRGNAKEDIVPSGSPKQVLLELMRDAMDLNAACSARIGKEETWRGDEAVCAHAARDEEDLV